MLSDKDCFGWLLRNLEVGCTSCEFWDDCLKATCVGMIKARLFPRRRREAEE